MNGATPTTQDTPDKGRLQINLVSDITAYPIQGARISISYTGIPETPLERVYYRQFRTDRYDRSCRTTAGIQPGPGK